ncbi:phenol 2-monooxygenase, putative [Talaromyces stipitatus ATCC 10500]|uniref:Phenol 2-monooxygenase, putative n=1 Tax=Talaromyces stipitatus (strain ATCC 10500 / CBS 375.48 / QM 6759 / NRRL 1006) TaxID=441959 RepID=B8LWX4_TALSN|nr:phenol 2-monooxygenase, putative [Talaromyces stipitatus ATCC 10500]EED24607.1 phenol 2-monooxygenase, putative [Talaromyces stipitatus ATCC 10500]
MTIQRTSVIVCGAGSAGLCAATFLACAGISSHHIKILERNAGPMKIGQADGVQCRTVEVFESFGLSEELLKDSYHVLEVCFWAEKEDPTATTKQLVRTRRTADTMPGLSHHPHVILNQASINGMLLKKMYDEAGMAVEYGWHVTNVTVDFEGDPNFPCVVTAAKGIEGIETTMRAKYVLGCDGAHSTVRRSLGYKMIGDSTDSVWGVMDVYPRTNFPDIRKKATLHTNDGNLMIIPREGDSLVRFYIELPGGTEAKSVKLEDLHQTTKEIFWPYTMDIAETMWWSAYSIGQRLVDHFHKDHRIFLTGDACHTHSPKAGQGMNVSLQDGYNLGWKLAAVLKGQAPSSILETYCLEREKVAADLIEFDRFFASIFSSKKTGHNPENFPGHFIKAGRYTAGLTAKYDDSVFTSTARSQPELARGLTVGMRFRSSQVVRFCDARAMQLVRSFPADGRWRIVIFAGDISTPACLERLNKLAAFLSYEQGPVSRFTPSTADRDSVIEPILVLHGESSQIEQQQIPEYFTPVNKKWRMRDLFKTFVDCKSYNSGHGHAYETYQIDKREGAIVIVRPDHYISLITSLTDYQTIDSFFEGFSLSPTQEAEGLLHRAA